jgi:hypothetical protein
MNTAADSRRTDEAMIDYVEWLHLSVAVQDAYVRWRRGPRGDRDLARRMAAEQDHYDEAG